MADIAGAEFGLNIQAIEGGTGNNGPAALYMRVRWDSHNSFFQRQKATMATKVSTAKPDDKHVTCAGNPAGQQPPN